MHSPLVACLAAKIRRANCSGSKNLETGNQFILTSSSPVCNKIQRFANWLKLYQGISKYAQSHKPQGCVQEASLACPTTNLPTKPPRTMYSTRLSRHKRSVHCRVCAAGLEHRNCFIPPNTFTRGPSITMPTSSPREGAPNLSPQHLHHHHHHSSLLHTDLQPPPSPRTHRALRRLQSAHTLGAKAASQGSLISQQYREALHRNASPVRSSQAAAAAPSPTSGGTATTANTTTTPAAGSIRHHQQPHRGRANSDAIAPMMHQMNVVGATRRTGVSKPVFSHGHLSLQQIIREGPTDGDFIGALESARWKVVDEGVKSAEDGMVSSAKISKSLATVLHFVFFSWLTKSPHTTTVYSSNLCLARSPRRPHHAYRRLPRSHSPRCVAGLRQDPQRHFSHTHH